MLKFLSTLIPKEKLPFKELTHKLDMLVALATAQRGQTLQLLDIGSMVEEPTAHCKIKRADLAPKMGPKRVSPVWH